MQIPATVFAWLVAFALAGPAFAATDSVQDQAPAVEPKPPELSRGEQLDELFAALKTAKTPEAGKAAENAIVALWLQSGSDTIDLLMAWTLKAIDEKNYALALDFLDRIVTMKPDYAEGWNKRATVHYLNDDFSKSIADIGRTLALEPRHFGALSGLGTIMRALGEEARAIDAYRRALAVDPYLESIKKALEELEAETAGTEL